MVFTSVTASAPSSRATRAIATISGSTGDSLTDIGLVPAARQRRTSSRRSEEHTSELQSQSNLVCRLLLEKKKKVMRISAPYKFVNKEFRKVKTHIRVNGTSIGCYK